MFVGSNNMGQYKLNIIPIKYDTTVSDLTILKCIDSLPGGLFHAKMYNLLYKDDSTRMAIQVNEGTYLFHTRFEVVEYYKNGAVKRRTYYNKHEMKYWEFDYYADASPKTKGCFKVIREYRENEKEGVLMHSVVKKGKWQYFDANGMLAAVEHYSHKGELKYEAKCRPRKTFTTIMNPKKPKGMPYVIQ
jgi:hypothetical protein